MSRKKQLIKLNQRFKKMLVYPTLFLFLSCHNNNQIEFNIENQTLITPNGDGIRNISISNDSINESYIITLKEINGEVPKYMKLSDIDDAYQIYLNGLPLMRENKTFRLNKNSSYTIEKYGGGATAISLKIWTNEESQVYKSE